MAEDEWRDEEISLFAVANTLLRSRWRIVRWMVIGGAVAALSVISKQAVYRATASFVPQGNESGPSGLASIAGQFGVALPAGNASQSPDFYVELVRSPTLLRRIASDTFVVQEMGGKRVPFAELFEIDSESARVRDEEGVQALRGMVKPEVSKTTGIIQVAVTTPWPSVSVGIVAAIISGVNDYNQRTRQSQAAAERKFVEGRLAVASEELRVAENRMQSFQQTNRQISVPQLMFEQGRIDREVQLRQQMFSSLTQSLEEVRLREVRDTPVITIFEPPTVPSRPEPRGRLKTAGFGVVIGAIIGIILAFTSGMMSRTQADGSADAREFMGAIAEMKRSVQGVWRRLTGADSRRTGA